MAAATVKSALFDNPTYPRKLPAGVDVVVWKETIPTTSLDDAEDRRKLIPLPNGVELLLLVIVHTDMDSGTPDLDADLVIADDDGDTIIYNAGTLFGSTAATTVYVVPPGTKIVKAQGNAGPGQSGVASLDFLVNTKAATAVEGTVTVLAVYKCNP